MTKIQWTDKTWNVNQGCSKISDGCKNCYAEKMHKRLKAMKSEKYQNDFNAVQFWHKSLSEPDKWKKPCMIFVNSMSDTFHKDISFEQNEMMFNVMEKNKHHIFQVLTKRPNRMMNFKSWMILEDKWKLHKNIWFGVTIENQKASNRRTWSLGTYLDKNETKFLSIEPLLSDIVFHGNELDLIDWVIIGCESGANKRPCKIEWIENIVRQCKESNIPIFIKQININNKIIKDINQFPKHLQIREFPKKY